MVIDNMTDEAKTTKLNDGITGLLELEQCANEGRPDLVINRIPKKTLKQFKDLARDEFQGDYGITLKYLMEEFLTDAKEYDMITRIMQLESHVSSILQTLNQHSESSNQQDVSASSVTFIKTLDQSIISDK